MQTAAAVQKVSMFMRPELREYAERMVVDNPIHEAIAHLVLGLVLSDLEMDRADRAEDSRVVMREMLGSPFEIAERVRKIMYLPGQDERMRRLYLLDVDEMVALRVLIVEAAAAWGRLAWEVLGGEVE